MSTQSANQGGLDADEDEFDEGEEGATSVAQVPEALLRSLRKSDTSDKSNDANNAPTRPPPPPPTENAVPRIPGPPRPPGALPVRPGPPRPAPKAVIPEEIFAEAPVDGEEDEDNSATNVLMDGRERSRPSYGTPIQPVPTESPADEDPSETGLGTEVPANLRSQPAPKAEAPTFEPPSPEMMVSSRPPPSAAQLPPAMHRPIALPPEFAPTPAPGIEAPAPIAKVSNPFASQRGVLIAVIAGSALLVIAAAVAAWMIWRS